MRIQQSDARTLLAIFLLHTLLQPTIILASVPTACYIASPKIGSSPLRLRQILPTTKVQPAPLSSQAHATKKRTQLLKIKQKTGVEGGPSAPEVQGFKSAGVTESVDLFTGDFTYNIPLLDVGGYPINLTYRSGIGLNDEASWVGLGWSLNPGAVNRSVRGLPDDFKGETITQEMNLKKNETIALNARVGLQIYGFEALSGTGSIGFAYNNYKGWSMSHSVGAALEASDNQGPAKLSGSLSFGVDSREGGSVNANIGLAAEKEGLSGNLGLGLRTTTREGLEEISYSASAKLRYLESNTEGALQFVAPTYLPKIEMPMRNKSITYHLTGGGEISGLHINGTITGAYNSQELLSNINGKNAYGYLYQQYAGTGDILDFNREKDGPYQKELPTLHITSPTYDLYQVTGQGLNEMFRPFRGDVGMLYDARTTSTGSGGSIGGEIGGGSTTHGGVEMQVLDTRSVSQKWEEDNALVGIFRFKENTNVDPLFEPVYFKSLAEQTEIADSAMFQRLGAFDAVRPVLSTPSFVDFGKAGNRLSNGVNLTDASQTALNQRVARNSQFTWRTAAEVAQRSYEWSRLNMFITNSTDREYRIGWNNRKAEHISEIEVTTTEGNHYLYSLPVYNGTEIKTTFNIGAATPDANQLVTYSAAQASIHNPDGENNFFNKSKTPPHAYAWLLTAVLSPDYVDIDNNGPTPDDNGTYTKFSYQLANENMGWRIPQEANKAIFDERYLSDDNDNQASYSYGKKELWYLGKIETRNYIAKFETSDRSDGKGVSNENGTPDQRSPKKLDLIKLFTQQELSTARLESREPVPIRTVHFEYDYSLCTGAPGSDAGMGKLTLQRIWFTHQDSQRDAQNPYTFHYGVNKPYHATSYDRWGNYKPNYSSTWSNDRFPYTNQNDQILQDSFSATWGLDQILLPTGGYMKIDYESDDYSYVQDKAAMSMVKVKGFSEDPNATRFPPWVSISNLSYLQV